MVAHNTEKWGALMRRSVAVAVACLSIVGLSFADDSSASIKKHTEISAQDLGAALQILARDRGFQIVYVSEEVGAKFTSGAIGEFTAEEALKQLLKGTGLTYRYLDDKTVTVLLPASATGTDSASPRSEGNGPARESSAPPAREDSSREGAQGKSFWDRFRLAQVDQGASSSADGEAASARRNASSLTVDEAARKARVEEIVVTAQKTEQRLQEVPVPVAVINAQSLVENNQLGLRDYYTSVPGLSMTPTSNQSTQTLVIRGITTAGATNPTVGIAIDDMPYGASTNRGGGLVVPDIDPSELARIEVLRGPQGTLYGASSMGGLVKFVTVDPSTDAVSGRVQAGVSSVYNGDELGYNVRGSINLPLGETWAVRFGGFTRQDPGYIDNPVQQVDGVNETHVNGGRLATLWRPSDAFSLKLSALVQQSKGDGSSDILVGNPSYGDLQQIYPLVGVQAFDRKVQAYSASANAKLGQVDLTSVSGFSVNSYADSSDLTSTFGNIFRTQFGAAGAPIYNGATTRKFTQELRLSAPLGQKLDGLLAAFYTHEDSLSHQNLRAVDPTTQAIASQVLFGRYPSSYEEYAVFGDLTYHFTDRFDVQIGGRESRIRQSYAQTFAGPYGPLFLRKPDPVIYPEEVRDTDVFTYLVAPRFRLSPSLMMYARLASGYRPGGPNLVPVSGTPPEVKPDTTRNYELGVKADLFGGALFIDTSLYYIDWRDIQLQATNPATAIGYGFNGSRAKSQGVELSIESRPMTGLRLAAWGAWGQAELTEPLPAAAALRGAPGDRLPISSRFSGSFSADQDFPLGNSASGFVGASVSYVGDRLGVFTSTGIRQHLPTYTKTDFRSGIRYGSWTGTLFVNNVTDRRGALQAVPTTGNILFILPRTVGLSVGKTF
jgi:outer membrane receptor protein involved in Fe transport